MTEPLAEAGSSRPGPRSALAASICIAARGLSTAATQMVSVAAGWQIYDQTESAFLLGMIGLIQFLPGLMLVILTGSVADRYDRRKVISLSSGTEAAVAACLAALVILGGDAPVTPMLLLLFCFALGRAFFGPAVMALLPTLVEPRSLPRIIAINSSVNQTAMVGGPVLGGVLYALAPMLPYAAAALFCLTSATMIFVVPTPPRRAAATRRDAAALLAGFLAIRRDRVLLGAISLDMFAVLLGGAVMLMPIFARDILQVGPSGLGILRGAAAGGGIAMALFLSFYPITRNAGSKLLITTAIFGLSTIAFGLSTSFWFSMLALCVMGASDMISVYIRSTLVQISTPDALRGRVNAVNLVFLSTSNELGGFRAGVMAAVIGATAAVTFGGVAMVAIAVSWSMLFPDMRRLDRLDALRSD